MMAVRNTSTSAARLGRGLTAMAALSLCVAFTSEAQAAISWDGGGNTNWWFDVQNWSQSVNNFLPPIQLSTDGTNVPIRTDAQINGGTGAWDLTGEGVVYDPVHDPGFAAAAGLTYVTGSALATTAGVMRDYGPETLYRFYVSRNTTNTNLVTIKSGDLVIESTTIIGRSGSTAAAQNLGLVVQTGGSVRFPLVTLDMGQRETSGWGNGTWDYRGGTLEVSKTGGSGIRLSAGSTTAAGQVGAGGVGKFIMHNPATGGHVEAFDFVFSSAAGIDEGVAGDPSDSVFDPLVDANGTTNGVSIAEFHFENGGARPIQVDRNLSINNGVDQNTLGMRSARLDLKLDAAPSVVAGVPQNLGLFDVNFGGVFGGTITGSGDLNNDMVFNNDRVFSNIGNTAAYREGDTVSAIFGSTKYNWTISYTGDIQWSDPVNSVVSSITGPTTGTDVVLMGLSTETLAVNNADFDGDGDVDGQDFLTWQKGLGVGTTHAQGDADNNNIVNAADLAEWKLKFGGAPAVGAAGAVPEPHSLALVALAGLSLGAVGRRR